MRLLIVEDDAVMAEAMTNILTAQHYLVDVAADGQIGWDLATMGSYELIVLDVMLPKLDGINLCQRLRQANYQLPILFLTAKDSSTDRVIGLDAGADDYVIKPFDFQELAARIRALLRRTPTTLSPILEWENLRLDPSTSEVTYNQKPLHLTPTEYSLLDLFLRHPARFFNRSAIIDHLWSLDTPPQESTVKSYIKGLRQKLKAAGAPPDLIETTYGLGYRLKPLPDSQEGTQTLALDAPSPMDAPSPIDAQADTIAQQTEAAIAHARESIKAKLGERLTCLKQAAQSLQSGSLSESLRLQAEQEAHKLAGTLGTVELIEASQLAEAIEDILREKPLNHSSNAPRLQMLVHQLCQALGEPMPAKSALPINTRQVPLALMLSCDQTQVEQWIADTSIDGIQRVGITLGAEAWGNDWNWGAIVSQKPDMILFDLKSLSHQPNDSRWQNELLQKLLPNPVLFFTDWQPVMHLLQKLTQSNSVVA
jgi:DNA-binding response OmpR family regulator/HPt (histidine-containing phosphotransfer) domain-containing protein